MKRFCLIIMLIGVAGLLFSCAARSPWTQGHLIVGLSDVGEVENSEKFETEDLSTDRFGNGWGCV